VHAAAQPSEQRDTGLSVLGRTPWSSHFSLFYETTEDLLDVIVPYFEAGLRAGELCVWLPAKPNLEKAVADRLRERLRDFDDRLARGDMHFVSAERFFRPEGSFEADAVLGRWRAFRERAINGGYAGMRGVGDQSWLGAGDWRVFSNFEEKLHALIANRPVILLCTYPLAAHGAADILDSACAHHVVIAKRGGSWQTLETPTLKQTKEQIQRVNEVLEQRVAERTRQLARSQAYLEEGQRLSHSGSFAIDAASGEYTYVSPENYRIFGFKPQTPVRHEDVRARAHPDDRVKLAQLHEALVGEGRDAELEFRIVLPDGRLRYIYKICHPVRDASGKVVEIVGTDVDITDRKRASAKLARAKRAAREQALEAQFAAALEERTRLAREIHDSLLQGVTGIALQLRATLPRLRGAPGGIADSIREVVELAETTIRDARRAVWDMRAPSLVQKGLHGALEESARRAAQNVELEFAIRGKPRSLPPEVEDTIFRVGLEAVINAVKHAAARSIKVKLAYTVRGVTLAVADDGRGFRVEPGLRSYAGRWGMLGMRERADRIGATLSIRSAARRGTTVTLRVPASRRRNGR
jgi:PAS domain S-box-containing protein